MSGDLYDRMREACITLTADNWHTEASVLNEAQMRIHRLETALRNAERCMSKHASGVGPIHAWWDYIFDFRELLK